MDNEQLANVLIDSFIGIWPSIAGTMNPDRLQLYKVQMIRGLMESGLNTPEAVSIGCKKARAEGGQYLPSVPEFIRWCKPEKKEQCHILLPRLEKLESTAEQRAEFIASMSAAMKGIK
jgi:hypothetical protein